jgi:transposase-like protein
MLSELHFKTLDNANRELTRRFRKLRNARASRDAHTIKRAEMEYFQSLQHLYAAVQDAIAER